MCLFDLWRVVCGCLFASIDVRCCLFEGVLLVTLMGFGIVCCWSGWVLGILLCDC